MSSDDGRVEKRGGGPGNDDHNEGHAEALHRFRSAASIAMSPELFEKLYLSPENRVHGDLRRTFGNPTPIGLAGFLLCLTPLSMDLMGWRGAGGNGAASIGVYFFQGGILMTLCGLLEWILGTTFSAVVFSVFGTFWLAWAATLSPSFAAFSSYAGPGAESPAEGLATRGFNASLAYWFLFMGVICLVFLICSLRTNICFVIIFLSLVVGFGLLTGAFLANADDFAGNASLAKKLVVGAGASTFVTCWAGWYIFLAMLLAAVDFPIQIPVGDLSTVIRGKSEKEKRA
ncbi:hypothetical protein PLIIFM63780_008135 [Purpureocillium lilacinum]|uniref:Plasma membrane ammonium transporter (Ato3) n=1 Tax=Purpureocillium lilacinum TaxID=33203 RepID=A0A179GQZ8_PURLI|nr:plasma membrane ammonium transporter (Ato3) [Purpureocillium lilacinum]GJN74058.1 hypothetical protein PLICBS_008146 [Purpureocillium lilacinum]GJN84574.1 hypothetical protein PLIIFM63780_008135 [Purpureocillium lilacinum]